MTFTLRTKVSQLTPVQLDDMGIVVPAAGADPLLMDELRELIKSFRSNDLLREATNPPGDPVLILEDQTVSPPEDVLEANVAEYLRSLLIARGGGAYSVPVADANGYTLVEGDIDMTGNVSIPNLDADGNIRVTDTTGGDPPLVRQILYRDGSFLLVDSLGEFDPRYTGSGGAHASTHERGGADEIDGDHLAIDFTPANYTPDITPPEADHVDDLAAHLAGIDTELGASGSTPPKLYKASATLDTTTTSQTYVPIDSMSLTPPAGDYHVLFTTSAWSDEADESTYFAIFVDGVIVAESETCEKFNVDSYCAHVVTQARVTVNGSQTIDVRWKVTAPPPPPPGRVTTATAEPRTLTALEVTSA